MDNAVHTRNIHRHALQLKMGVFRIMLNTVSAFQAINYSRQEYIKGNFKAGFEVIEEVWRERARFSGDALGKIALCRGILLGAYDYYVRGNSQHQSRETLLEALNIFDDTQNSECILLTANSLAVSHCRTGEYEKAQAFLNIAFTQPFPESYKGRMYSRVAEAVFYNGQKDYQSTLKTLSPYKDLFDKAHDYLKAQFYQSLGVARYGLKQDAVWCFQNASRLFNQLGHLHYLFIAENNLANCYLQADNTTEAMRHTENAVRLARKLGNFRLIGGGLDTQAQIALRLGRLDDALYLSDTAVKTLRPVGGFMLGDAYETKIKVLLAQKDLTTAMLVLSEAARFTKNDKLAGLIADYFKQSSGVAVIGSAVEKTSSVFGVRVKDDYFAHLGIRKDCALIIEKGTVKNGEFAAVLKDGKYSFGFIDVYFGVINLVNGRDAKPHFFYEETASVVGKVIGYCKPNQSKIFPLRFGG